MQAEQVQHQNELEAQRQMLTSQHAAQLKQMEIENARFMAQMQDDFNRWKTQQDNETKVVVANISASAKAASAAETESGADATEPAEEKPDTNLALAEAMKALAEQFAKPRTVIRGPDGKVIGLQ